MNHAKRLQLALKFYRERMATAKVGQAVYEQKLEIDALKARVEELEGRDSEQQ